MGSVGADVVAEEVAATTPPPAAVEKVSYKNLNAVIKDPDLGHTITATRLARHLKWPAGQPIGAEQFEIVGVRVTAAAGSRYSASIDPSMFSLIAADPKQTVTPTSEFTSRWNAAPLKSAKRSATTSGWVFFKINRGTTSALRLAFNRPAYAVKTTDKSIPAKTFSVVLTKHTLAVTNRGGATTADVLALARQVRDGVRDMFGVTLVNEPVLVGEQL